jgi:hypothetical protein
VVAGGTVTLTVTLDRAAPPGGTMVSLSADPMLTVPVSVTIPEGQTMATFDVLASGPDGSVGVVSATLDGISLFTTVSIGETAVEPTVGSLIINEVLADPDATTAGDANCDGIVSTVSDEFVEIVNVSTQPLQLGGTTISDSTSTRFTFPSLILQPGEPVVVFGGALGLTGIGPWCANLDGSHIGAAQALAGASLSLNNGGDTVTLTDASSVIISSVTYGAEGGNNQSLTRDPDKTGGFVLYSVATGSLSDRLFSPGTQNDGSAFP